MKNKPHSFKQFQKYFLEYQKLFGVTGYKIYFKHEPIDSFASICVNQGDMVATVRLNNTVDVNDKPFEDMQQFAKHEALHLLLWRIEDRAASRYTIESDICEAIEEVVFKLEKLIPDARTKAML